MKRVVLTVLIGLVFVVGGCKFEIEDDDHDKRPSAHVKGKQGRQSQKKNKKRNGSIQFNSGKDGTSISIVDGDEVVELHAGGNGAHLKIKSGEDTVLLKADDLGANIQVDEKNDTVKLHANAKGARISVKSGKDSVTLNADDLHATIMLKQGKLPSKPKAKPKIK